MRMIFEENIEKTDFLEIILTSEEVDLISITGVVREFQPGICGKRTLNVYLRVDPYYEEEYMPLVKGKAAKTKEGFSENVKREMEAGKPQKQAVAIAYSEARRGKKKKTKKGAK